MPIVPRITRFLEARLGGKQAGIPSDAAKAISLVGEETMAAFLKQMLDTKRDEYYKGKWDYPSGWKCARAKLFKKLDEKYPPTPLEVRNLFVFIYGDLIETLVKALAIAAGCKVSAGQERVLSPLGNGRLDFILTLQEEGADHVEMGLLEQGYKAVMVEVKSMEGYSFDRWFKEEELSDMWGYRAQQSACLEAVEKSFPATKPPEGCAPLALYVAVNKVNGVMRQKFYPIDKALLKVRKADRAKVEAATKPDDIDRPFEPQSVYGLKKDGYPFLGNKLGLQCSYCDFKFHCWGSSVRPEVLKGKPVFWVDDAVAPLQPPGKRK